MLINIEDLIGSDHDDTLIGDAGQHILEGGGGADHLDGGRIYKSTASYAGSGSAVSVNLGAGTASGGDAEGDVLINIGHLIGSDHDDTLTGDSGNNTLEGGGGADTLDGGGWQRDTASYAGSASGVVVNLEAGTGSGGDAEGDVLINIEDITGSDYDDTLTGDSGINLLRGGAGDDALYGGDGDDILIGHYGDDVLHGDDGDDRLYGDDGDDRLRGGFGNDVLYGGASDDILSGHYGDDVLNGDYGDDWLEGGEGDDVYYFGGYRSNHGDDTIVNHGESASEDLLRLQKVEADDLSFRQNGDDLVIDLNQYGTSVTIDDWYVGQNNRLDIELDDGSRLLASDVQVLVNAMAAFAPPGDGATDYTEAQRAVLDPLIAANWQMPAS